MVRRALDTVYVVSGYLAGAFLIAIGVLIVAQIGGRFVRVAVDATELSGFCLAAMTYFGLAFTFRKGSHIRVDLVIRHVQGRARRIVEIWCCAAATGVLCYLSYFTVVMVWKSYVYGDLSTSLVAVPMWMPQFPMAVGCVVLTIAVAEELIAVIRGRPPRYDEIDEEEIALMHGSKPGPDLPPGPGNPG